MSSENKRLHIVFDTNTIKDIHPNYNTFSLSRTFEIPYRFLVLNKLDFCTLHIPQICIEELLKQFCEEYKFQVNAARKKYDDFLIDAKTLGWSCESDYSEISQEDYSKQIAISAKKYFDEHGDVNVIAICSNEKMPYIIERALSRRDPFFTGHYNQKKFTDAGFKDVVFLESIIEHFSECTDKIVICTGDKILLNVRCKDEFSNKDVEFFNLDSGDEIVKYVCELYGVKDMSEHYLFCANDYFFDTIADAVKCEVCKKIISLKETEIGDYTCIDVQLEIGSSSGTKEILVRLTAAHDFDEILDFATSEVLFSWK